MSELKDAETQLGFVPTHIFDVGSKIEKTIFGGEARYNGGI